ncbi:carbohydrate ABC transporter permease [Kribbella deserti]|uniref:Carbohydrate ABC transporter permease n=1 Tax=Kribbella deserti TaxID=1926257 RepID=A0ABV6QDI0_9ACTN
MSALLTQEPALADVQPQTPVRRPSGSRRGWTGRPGFLVYGLLAAFLLGSAFPLYWSFIVASHKPSVSQDRVPPLLPGGNLFANIERVIDTIPFWKALGNSIVVSSAVTLSVVVFSTLAGFAFAKLKFKGRNGLMGFVIATMAVPTQLGVIPLFMVMAKFGWAGSLSAVIVPAMVSAFGVFWMRQYLVDAIPDELIEAARMDGCSTLRVFWHVCAPAARPAAGMLGLFTFMQTWTDFLWPLVVLNPESPTLQVALNQLQSGYYVDYSLVLAGAVMATLPIFFVFLVAGRQLVAGIMQGAVKG